jgi:D-amino-acid dehydrogenase
MKVAILGAGIIGVCTAWWLRQTGHEVIVVDRCTGPGQETSFANGAQISVSYAEPWAEPRAPYRLCKWLFLEDAPLLFRPQLDWRQWVWGAAFLRECWAGRWATNVRAMVGMAKYSRTILQTMRDELSIEYDHLQHGILNFYRDSYDFKLGQQAARIMRDFGVERHLLNVDEVVALEPALAAYRPHIVGGDFTPDDESGDAYQFTVALASRCAAVGVKFCYATQVTRLITAGNQVGAIEVLTADGAYGQLEADAFVVAMGSESPLLLSPLKIPCNIYPAKGYSATFPITDLARAPTVSLTDNSRKVVFSRLGNRLRMAGMAELSGYSRALNQRRCDILLHLAQELFPDILDFEHVAYWSGLRPATPSNVPLIGRTRISNLYLNTGHGALGWTMGAGSGRALADLMSGRRPEPAFPFLGL